MYVVCELALEQPGKIFHYVDHHHDGRSLRRREDVEAIKLFIENAGLAPYLSVNKTHGGVTQRTCIHCGKYATEHGEQGKCLFDATWYYPLPGD